MGRRPLLALLRQRPRRSALVAQVSVVEEAHRLEAVLRQRKSPRQRKISQLRQGQARREEVSRPLVLLSQSQM